MKLSKENKQYIRDSIQKKADKKIKEYEELSKQSSENIHNFLDKALKEAKETFCNYIKKNKKVMENCSFRKNLYRNDTYTSFNEALKECKLEYENFYWSDDKNDYSKKIDSIRGKTNQIYNQLITKIELGDTTIEELEAMLNEVSFDDN